MAKVNEVVGNLILAFPQHAETGNLENWRHGMELRDYFAAQALTGMIASSPITDRTDPQKINKPGWAKQAYEFANAMMVEREK